MTRHPPPTWTVAASGRHMGYLVPPMPRPRYRAVCAYCRTDPVKAACVNCGAPQQDQGSVGYLTTTRALSAQQVESIKKQWEAAYR